jgi:hypothetical protein
LFVETPDNFGWYLEADTCPVKKNFIPVTSKQFQRTFYLINGGYILT